jgi:murein DD-endopeptidase MepM/ murein hydrolase activator NlpD
LEKKLRLNARNLILLALCAMLLIPIPAQAQQETPISGPVYIIQPGDSLSVIAIRFNVSLSELMSVNNISNANQISAGARLVIPGLEGLSGVLVTEVVAYGETLESLSRRYQASRELLVRLNRISSPSQVYAGVGLVFLQQEGDTTYNARTTPQRGETLLEVAVRQQSDIWTMKNINQLSGTWSAMPGDILYSPGEASTQAGNGLPPAFISTQLNALPLVQGGTSVIRIQTLPGVRLSGTLIDMPLNFFPLEDGTQVALQGVHAMLEPGAYPLQLRADLPDGSVQSFEQYVLVTSGFYPDDPILLVEPETINPQVTETEFNKILELVHPVTSERMWQTRFTTPAALFPDPNCYTSRYGNRRTYLGSGTDERYYSFHSGLDWCGGKGLPVVAPAAGVVVMAENLPVRGNAILIDHGWGIYTGYWHLDQMQVSLGQRVSPSQQIGTVGATGRVTGAHLHWEVWVNGIQANPFPWLQQVFP